MGTHDHRMLRAGGRLAGHAMAVVGGILLAIVGLGMGVSIVALPVGIPLGLVGIGLLLWGLWGPLGKED